MVGGDGQNCWPEAGVIVTRRLRLRPIELADVPALIRLWTDQQVRYHLGGALSYAEAQQRATQSVGARGGFCVTALERATVLGLCSLSRYRTGDIEVSYQLLPEYWGRGLGRETVAAVVSWGLANLDVDRIVAITQTANWRSRRLLEALGMSVIAEFIEHGEPQTMYAISRPSKRMSD